MSADYWEFGDMALTSLGVITKLSDYLELPARRGDNILIPYQDGRIFLRKFFDQRVIQMGMALTEANAAALESKIEEIKILFGQPYQQLLRVRLEDATVRQAFACVDGGIDVVRLSAGVAKLVIPFKLADPYFRSEDQTSDETTIDDNPKTFTIINPGTAEERKAIITLTGPLSHPIITNAMNGAALQFDDVLAAGADIVTIDCGAFTAVDETNANVIAKIIHTGDVCFLPLVAGDNDLTVEDGTATTGKVKFEFYAPYL